MYCKVGVAPCGAQYRAEETPPTFKIVNMDNLLVEALEKIATTCFNLGHAEEVARKALSQYNALPGSQVGEEIKIIKRGIHHVIAESEGLGY